MKYTRSDAGWWFKCAVWRQIDRLVAWRLRLLNDAAELDEFDN